FPKPLPTHRPRRVTAEYSLPAVAKLAPAGVPASFLGALFSPIILRSGCRSPRSLPVEPLTVELRRKDNSEGRQELFCEPSLIHASRSSCHTQLLHVGRSTAFLTPFAVSRDCSGEGAGGSFQTGRIELRRGVGKGISRG